MIDEAFAASLRAYNSMPDGLTGTETDKDFAALLEKLLRRLDHLSRERRPGRPRPETDQE